MDIIYDVCKTVELMKESGQGEEGRVERWLDGLRELDRQAGVSASVTLFLVYGQKGG